MYGSANVGLSKATTVQQLHYVIHTVTPTFSNPGVLGSHLAASMNVWIAFLATDKKSYTTEKLYSNTTAAVLGSNFYIALQKLRTDARERGSTFR